MVLADVRLYREGLARLLAGEPRLTVVAAEPVNESSLLRVHAEQIDVVLLEAATACETRVIEELARLAPGAKVVAYAVLDEDRQGVRCAEAGATEAEAKEAKEAKEAGKQTSVVLLVVSSLLTIAFALKLFGAF